MLVPVARFMFVRPPSTWSQPACAPAVACAVVVVLYMIDNLMNAMHNPVFILMAGGLAGLARVEASPPEPPPALTDRTVFQWSLNTARLRRPPTAEPRPRGGTTMAMRSVLKPLLRWLGVRAPRCLPRCTAAGDSRTATSMPSSSSGRGTLHAIGTACSILTSTVITDPRYVRLGNNISLSACALIGHDGAIAVLEQGLQFAPGQRRQDRYSR